MECLFYRLLILSGFAAIGVIVATTFGKYFLSILDSVHNRWKRLNLSSRLLAVLIATIATVQAQTVRHQWRNMEIKSSAALITKFILMEFCKIKGVRNEKD